MIPVLVELQRRVEALERDSHPPQPVVSAEEGDQLWRAIEQLRTRITELEETDHG